jgi:hypothetical protein
LLGTLLNAHPTATHLLDGSFTRRIAWPRPHAHLSERRGRSESFGDGLLRLRTFGAFELPLPSRSGSLTHA